MINHWLKKEIERVDAEGNMWKLECIKTKRGEYLQVSTDSSTASTSVSGVGYELAKLAFIDYMNNAVSSKDSVSTREIAMAIEDAYMSGMKVAA